MRRINKALCAKILIPIFALVAVFCVIGGVTQASSDKNEPFLPNGAIEYGIVCNHLNQTADMETNFAALKYQGNGHTIGNVIRNDRANAAGRILVGEIIGGTQFHSNPVVIEGKEAEEQVKAMLAAAKSYSSSVVGNADYTTTDEVKNMNHYVVDIVDIKNDTVYVNADNMVDAMNADKLKEGALKLKMRANQTVVFNSKEKLRFTLPRYSVEFEGQAKTKEQTAETVIWNMPNVVNLGIKSDNINATIIAPNASVNLETTAQGWLVCDTVVSNSGEWHMISQKVPDLTPTKKPTEEPKATPTKKPTEEPKATPTKKPTEEPKATPTKKPTATPASTETPVPTEESTVTPAPKKTPEPTGESTVTPAPTKTPEPTGESTVTPAPTKTPAPTEEPTKKPTATPVPTEVPKATPAPTEEPTPTPTVPPFVPPTATPAVTEKPTATPVPTEVPTATSEPTEVPTATPEPTEVPTATPVPTAEPTPTPTVPPFVPPTATPAVTDAPTATPAPTEVPTATPAPTVPPFVPMTATPAPTDEPEVTPTADPTETPVPTEASTATPAPTADPTETPEVPVGTLPAVEEPTATPTTIDEEEPPLASAEPTETPTITTIDEEEPPLAQATPESKTPNTKTILDDDVPLSDSAPKTGDSTNLLIPILGMGLSLVVIAAVMFLSRKKRS